MIDANFEALAASTSFVAELPRSALELLLRQDHLHISMANHPTMAHTVMAYVVRAYIIMAHIVMACMASHAHDDQSCPSQPICEESFGGRSGERFNNNNTGEQR